MPQRRAPRSWKRSSRSPRRLPVSGSGRLLPGRGGRRSPAPVRAWSSTGGRSRSCRRRPGGPPPRWTAGRSRPRPAPASRARRMAVGDVAAEHRRAGRGAPLLGRHVGQCSAATVRLRPDVLWTTCPRSDEAARPRTAPARIPSSRASRTARKIGAPIHGQHRGGRPRRGPDPGAAGRTGTACASPVSGPPSPTYTRQLWAYRHFIAAYANAKLAASFSTAQLGQLWQVLTPLINAAVYYLIFGVMLNTRAGHPELHRVPVHRPLHLQLHPDRGARPAPSAISGNLGLIRALHFPRASLPIAVTLTQFQQLLVVDGRADRHRAGHRRADHPEVAADGARAAAAGGLQRRPGAGRGPARRQDHRPQAAHAVHHADLDVRLRRALQRRPTSRSTCRPGRRRWSRPTRCWSTSSWSATRCSSRRRRSTASPTAALAARRRLGGLVGVGGFVYFWRGDRSTAVAELTQPPASDRPRAGPGAHPHRRRGRRARRLPGARRRRRASSPVAALQAHRHPAPTRPNVREVHAVKGVSFAAYRGEAIGLIGSNGSGKSTLLRAIAGLLPAEPGRGLHPGPAVAARRERGAAQRPVRRAQRRARLPGHGHDARTRSAQAAPEIIEFSGINERGDFISLPMRTYSSGMAARLRFSIAAAKNHDVLLIDEALATGDARFRQRSEQRVRELREEAGTVFLVSHQHQLDPGHLRADDLAGARRAPDGRPDRRGHRRRTRRTRTASSVPADPAPTGAAPAASPRRGVAVRRG